MTPYDWTYWIVLGPLIGIIWMIFVATFITGIVMIYREFFK